MLYIVFLGSLTLTVFVFIISVLCSSFSCKGHNYTVLAELVTLKDNVNKEAM